MIFDYDVIIVGAGPAGCSAALWLKQLGFSPLLVEKNNACGGLQLSNPYTNTWIASSANVHGKDVAAAMHQNMLDHNIDMMLGAVASNAFTTEEKACITINGKVISARYLVLATGVQFKSGGYKERAGLIVGPGVRVASTDFTGLDVAILGGGDNAFENYAFVSSRGAKSVTIFARTLRARSEMIERTPIDRIHLGDFSFNPDQNTINGHRFDQVLVMYGYEASSTCLLGLQPAMSPEGFVVTDHQCFTSIPRVLAIGEIARRCHPCCVTAMADGVTAAKSIQSKIEETKRQQIIGAIKRGSNLLGKIMSV